MEDPEATLVGARVHVNRKPSTASSLTQPLSNLGFSALALWHSASRLKVWERIVLLQSSV